MNIDVNNEIVNYLIVLGYNKDDISNGIRDVKMRLLWSIHSLCSIYSRKNKKWCKGKIIDIFINEKTNKEWLTVKYNDKNTKKMQRFNENIKPINLNYDSNQQIVRFIYNKLKENNSDQVVFGIMNDIVLNSKNNNKHQVLQENIQNNNKVDSANDEQSSGNNNISIERLLGLYPRNIGFVLKWEHIETLTKHELYDRVSTVCFVDDVSHLIL